MRPIVWGLIFFIIGLIGWIAFSILAGICSAVTPTECMFLMFLVYLFGFIFFFSMPLAFLFEVIIHFKKKQKSKS